jgi:hypothetical protein
MSTLLVALVVLLSAVAPAPAAEEKPRSPQAQRMKDCNAQARERSLAGDARKHFMSECLKGTGSRPADGSSQSKEASRETGALGASNPQSKP